MNDLVKSEYAYGGQLADEVFAEWLESGMQIGHRSLMGESYRAGFIDRLAELLDVRRGRGDRVVGKATGNAREQKRAGISLSEIVPQECLASVGSAMRGDS